MEAGGTGARWGDPAHGRYEIWELRTEGGKRSVRLLHAARSRSEARLYADAIARETGVPRSSLVVQDTRRRRWLKDGRRQA